MPLQIVGVRVEQADSKHDHVELVGYYSKHIASEPIMLTAERTIQRMGIGDSFYMLDGDQQVEVVSGQCPVCGAAPYLRTKADSGNEQKLLSLELR